MNVDNYKNNIFNSPHFDFEHTAIEVFQFQYKHNDVYQRYVNAIGINPHSVTKITDIPFLPIRFFKTHKVVNTQFPTQLLFESSGTTHTTTSRHYLKDAALYEQSFMQAFRHFYGAARNWCIIGLLPAYLERQHSSLVYMVNRLIAESQHPSSGFYLHNTEALAAVLQQLEAGQQPTLLIGVTFALLDFSQRHPMPLHHTTIMETGGMKGRRKELVREEVHAILSNAFGAHTIHSEYGMTELLSQAYSKEKGIFHTPPWMKILIREEEDPLSIKNISEEGSAKGIINVIDLANIYSCSFIATDDMGILYSNHSFEVKGRMDNSDIRGCSLLAL